VMATKLYLTERPARGVPGGKALMLVDQDGDVIPAQVSCDLHQAAGEISSVTVAMNIHEAGVTLGDPVAIFMTRANRMAAAAIDEIAMLAIHYKQSHGLQ